VVKLLGAVAATLLTALAAEGHVAVHAKLTIEAPPVLASTARAIGELAHGDFSPELDLVGLDDFGAPIHVVLAAEDSALARNVPSWLSGYALGALSTVVLFPARVPAYPDGNLEALLRHEVTHVLTYRAADGRALPRWFAEGLAIVGAREWGIEDRARYTLAVLGRGPDSFRALDDAFVGDASGVNRAYALSGALVRSLASSYGTGTPARVLALVARGVPFRDALERATGHSSAEIQRAFFEREALWDTWVPFLTSSTALWMAITLLAVWAIRRRRLRDAEARARAEAEEAMLDHAWADELERMRIEHDDPRRYN
jgi:hypothetical protein